jgi:hypothetical protein
VPGSIENHTTLSTPGVQQRGKGKVEGEEHRKKDGNTERWKREAEKEKEKDRVQGKENTHA